MVSKITRTRTGCKTCRARKLKCDEEKPVCGQCRKSNRQCVRAEGVTFRHAQNPGVSTDDGNHQDLSSFYKYRQKFNQDHYFLPVPKELHFVHITDPYAEELTMNGPDVIDYQQVAAHSLRALSTAATGENNAALAHGTSYAEYAGLYTHDGGRRAGLGSGLGNYQNGDISFLLNPQHTSTNLIDPNLELADNQHIDPSVTDHVHAVTTPGIEAGGPTGSNEQDDAEAAHLSEQILAALRNSTGMQDPVNGEHTSA